MLLASFPSISQTFIVGQFTGLIDLGHEVDIYVFPNRIDYNARLIIKC